MSRKTRIHIFTVILFLSFHAQKMNAQKASRDYIETDSSFRHGFVTSLGKTLVEFSPFAKATPVIYTAAQVLEFRDQGKIFVSVPINSDRIFLKQLVPGEHRLLANGRSYILRQGDSHTFLDKKNFRSALKEKLGIRDEEGLPALAFSRPSLRNFLRMFNEGNLNPQQFPHRKFGITAGYNALQLDVEKDGHSLLDNANGFSAGFFADVPFYRPRRFYFSTEININKTRSAVVNRVQHENNFAILDITGFNVPIAIKWVLPGKKITPYLKGGPFVSWWLVDTPGIYKFSQAATVITTSIQHVDPEGALLFGYHAGFGAEIRYKDRQKIHLETRYMRSFQGSYKLFDLDFSAISLTAGFNF